IWEVKIKVRKKSERGIKKTKGVNYLYECRWRTSYFEPFKKTKTWPLLLSVTIRFWE
ncbi:hypothetical protein PHYSODRAFT_527987, partial [Phytophthora sojae]